MELLAKVYDHARHRFTHGFRMLTPGWSDGVTFLPVSSCLLSTENQQICTASDRRVQVLSYDAMCAQCAIVFARYMFLAVGIRENQNIRTAEPLFCLEADKLADISLAESMEKLLEVFHASKQDICALTADFIRSLPEDIANFLEFPTLKRISALKSR